MLFTFLSFWTELFKGIYFPPQDEERPTIPHLAYRSKQGQVSNSGNVYISMLFSWYLCSFRVIHEFYRLNFSLSFSGEAEI